MKFKPLKPMMKFHLLKLAMRLTITGKIVNKSNPITLGIMNEYATRVFFVVSFINST